MFFAVMPLCHTDALRLCAFISVATAAATTTMLPLLLLLLPLLLPQCILVYASR
jgi:hypothetical protein